MLKSLKRKTIMETLIGATLIAPTAMAATPIDTVSYQQVANQAFKDVASNHYAYDAISWGKQKGLISGYSNGTFGPNDNVTEAQFVKMVTNYLGLQATTSTNQTGHWSDANYNALAKYGVPLNGYSNNSVRNSPVKRGTVALTLGYLFNGEDDLEDSIEFLLARGITSGQNAQFKGKDIYQFFGTENNLTRAQVITFLYRMSKANITNISPEVSKPQGTTSTQLISKDKAISIAKQKAQGTLVKAELDYDNGLAIYEIEIRDGRMEYAIEINALTGAIIKFKSEYDD